VDENIEVAADAPATSPAADASPATAPAPAADAPVLQKGDTPILLSQALFVVGFSEYYFTPWFDLAMQADPEFGSNRHGHKTRLFVQQSYLMTKELEEMMCGDKWKELSVFRPFITSLDGLPSLSDVKKGGLEFINKAVDVFFREYKTNFFKHIVEHWTSQMIAPYIIGGDPRLAREYIRWLNACREGALEAGTFEWSQEVIELKNHKVHGGSHKICIGECMLYVTQNSSAVEVMEEPFIKEILDQLLESLESEQVVNFLDKSTWPQEGEYDLVRKQICERIVPHAMQQQRVECVVQNINAMARTNVKECRRTVRAVIFSICLHPYNRESVDKKREERSTFEDKQKVKTTNGAERITGLFDHVLKDLKEADEAVREIGQQKYDEIFEHYRNPDGKTSTVEREKKVEEFGAAIEKTRKITKAQRSGNIHVPVDVGGGIPLTYTLPNAAKTKTLSGKRLLIVKSNLRGAPAYTCNWMCHLCRQWDLPK